ncbi:MAG: SDR family oxidoreductase [Dongiaceae bacterium]
MITGSTGGIGSALTRLLATPETRLTILARDPARLTDLARQVNLTAASVFPIQADLTEFDLLDEIVAAAIERHGPIDVLINNAAINRFGQYEHASRDEIAGLVSTNLLAPMLLTHAVLPGMLSRRQGRIVNIGSVMGSIGFAGFAAYCSGKFALRGFSEVLRRELKGRGVRVTYIAPRYTRTALNSPLIDRMASEVGMVVDDPADVARRILAAIDAGKAECFIGRSEGFFARLNGVLPQVVDLGLARTTRKILEITGLAA